MCLSDTQTDCVCEALAKRTSGDFNAIGMSSLGVTGRQRTKLTEALEVVNGQLEAEQVQKDVLQSASAKGSEYYLGVLLCALTHD